VDTCPLGLDADKPQPRKKQPDDVGVGVDEGDVLTHVPRLGFAALSPIDDESGDEQLALSDVGDLRPR
jgi:hypothetical protein